MRTEAEKQDLREKALTDMKVLSGVYHAIYMLDKPPHMQDFDCWCKPEREEVLYDGEPSGKIIYWHNHPDVGSLSQGEYYADPAKSWPFSKEQVEIINGAEHTQVRS